MEYLSIQDISRAWDISKRRVQFLCRENRIKGVKRIGNMWVIPQNAEKPNDERTKNPVVKKKCHCLVRSDLKVLLRKMYKRCVDINILEDDKKAYVLSILAATLCQLYLDKADTQENVYKQIFKDISGKETEYAFDEKILLMANEYVHKYREDKEIENIMSWAYQYANKIMLPSDYSKTQFFTEKYMVKHLTENISAITFAKKILDPCLGGGNFLVECLEILCSENLILNGNIQEQVISQAEKLYGYDIDSTTARIATVNIKIKALSIMHNFGENPVFDVWRKISPNIYTAARKDLVCGSLAKDNRRVKNVLSGETAEHNAVFRNADVILTNPPFTSVKGMPLEQKSFLKEFYPLSNCDTCVAFLEAIENMLSDEGICGFVSQNAWMFLETFKNIRRKFAENYMFHRITNLGSGAFLDLNGEKSNVALLIFGKSKFQDNHDVIVQNLAMEPLTEKMKKLEQKEGIFRLNQKTLNGTNGFVLSPQNPIFTEGNITPLYNSVAVPMQGTSTGDSKELVDFFWTHFGDKEWILVSKGGGYCRWEGLNNSIVKWGKDGEYIREQKGSALRNVKYFNTTRLVFSDTGTAGLNVRILLKNQIFIASGPGIRILDGNEYAHLAFLNSRLAASYLRSTSPKLTISAGYIGRIPIKESIFSSSVLEKNARLCVELKRNFLKNRPNNYEYVGRNYCGNNISLDKEAWSLFLEELANELFKLELESQCDKHILVEYGLDKNKQNVLNEEVGKCAFCITDKHRVDIAKLDRYMSNLLDTSCMLKRSKTSRNSLGSDGILEFASKDFYINPANLFEQIIQTPELMKNTLMKYKNLIIHNRILEIMGYTVQTGIKTEQAGINDIALKIEELFDSDINMKVWITKNFNTVHFDIFKGKPFLYFENEVVKKHGQ